MELYSYQKRIARLVRQGKNIILQAPTGAGKTLAALWPFIQAWAADNPNVPRKCVYAVPMRVLANQFDREYRRICDQEMLLQNPPVIKRQTGEHKDDPEFRADLIFATIDQVLSSWLLHPYSLSQRQGNLNAGAFVGSYLVFDEFHLFDPDSTLPTSLHMLKTLRGVSPFVLMTATFSGSMLASLAKTLDAEPVLLMPDELKEIPAQHKERRYTIFPESLTAQNTERRVEATSEAVAHIWALHQAQSGRPRTLVVCNQVERAQAVYQALREKASPETHIELLHNRFLRQDRQIKEKLVEREFGKDPKPRTLASLIVVATQVVEVGLDISSAVLHTELAPASAVLQRAGRCARYAGETGQVVIYRLADTDLHPYHEKQAADQCRRTWEWLVNNQDRHLTFADEQAWIDHVHTPADQAMVEVLRSSALELDENVRRLWRGAGDRGEASKLVRQVSNLMVTVHDDPDQLRHAPFQVDQFSLFHGTLLGKFKNWQTQNEALDADWDTGKLDWLVQGLVEDRSDDEAQANQPIRYAFKPVHQTQQLYAPLLVINPALVGYSVELGLTLYPSYPYRVTVPSAGRDTAGQPRYTYRLESYRRHIELVHQAFTEVALGDVRLAGRRLEQVFGWASGVVEQVAHLIVVGHDLGKLNVAWQNAVRRWQKTAGASVPDFAIAHTDFDPEQHRHLPRARLPHHAVEGAVAAIPLLEVLIPDDEQHEALLRAAFTAIARHHAPFSTEISPYRLIRNHHQIAAHTWTLLPPAVTASIANQLLENEVEVERQSDYQRLLDENYFVRETNPADMCAYMLLVRALRFADQEGTARGMR
ncbi:MAG: CRISPR-associated helicase Cas3' [Chloroflexi bacterium]|nr:CRISPR-associated helicase Cas3' [Chloroflexota bacterium]